MITKLLFIDINPLLNFEMGQVDSPESPEMPETTEKMESFIKVNKYLTKLEEALINYLWKKSHFK